MRGPQKVIDFLGCPAPKRCPERRNYLIEKSLSWKKDEILPLHLSSGSEWRLFVTLFTCHTFFTCSFFYQSPFFLVTLFYQSPLFYMSPWGEAEGSHIGGDSSLSLRSGSEWQNKDAQKGRDSSVAYAPSEAVLSRSPELMRRVCEGITKSHWKRFLSAILNDHKNIAIFKILINPFLKNGWNNRIWVY